MVQLVILSCYSTVLRWEVLSILYFLPAHYAEGVSVSFHGKVQPCYCSFSRLPSTAVVIILSFYVHLVSQFRCPLHSFCSFCVLISASRAFMAIYNLDFFQVHLVLVLSQKSTFFKFEIYSFQYDPRAFSGNLPASWPAYVATYLYLVAKLVCQRAFNSTDHSHGSCCLTDSQSTIDQYFLRMTINVTANATVFSLKCSKMVSFPSWVTVGLEIHSNIDQSHQLLRQDLPVNILSHCSLPIQELIMHFLSMGNL